MYEDLSSFDLLYVAGGLGTVTLMDNKRAVDYLKTWGDERPLASVCSGALLLGCADYLRDKRAMTHHQAVELLRPLCREVVTNRRVVDEGRIVTAGGVSSALDQWPVPGLLSHLSVSPQRLLEPRRPLFPLNAATPSAWSAVCRTIDMWDETRSSACAGRAGEALVDEPLDHPDRDLRSVGDLPGQRVRGVLQLRVRHHARCTMPEAMGLRAPR